MKAEAAPSTNIKMLTHHSIFNLVRELYPKEEVRFSCHLPSGIPGGLSLLESAILVSLMKTARPKEIFEFGTYLGASTVLMATNSDDTKITTLDLEPSTINVTNKDSLDITEKSQNDDFLRATYQERGVPFIDKADIGVREKISQLYCDSRKLDLQKNHLEKRFEFIFIDGGHDLDIIESDTKKAQKMRTPDSIVTWHDYTSKVHTDVTRYLDDICTLSPIYHIQHTMIAIHPTGRFIKIFEKLLTENHKRAS